MALSRQTYRRRASGLKTAAERVSLLREGVAAFPDDVDMWESLGAALWETGEREASVAAWYQEVELDGSLECPWLIL